MDFIQTFGTIFLTLILFYISKFLLGFFTTKGNNLATKSDIEKITKIQQDAINKIALEYTGSITEIQENVKAEFIKQNEIIKAELSFSNQHKLNLMTLEREAIFEYNKKFLILQSLLRDLTFLTVKEESVDYYDNLIIKLDAVLESFELSSGHLTLFFINDRDFGSKRLDLSKKIIEYNTNLAKKIKEVRHVFVINNINKVEFNIKEIEKVNKIMMDFRESHEDKYLEITKSHIILLNYLSSKFKV